QLPDTIGGFAYFPEAGGLVFFNGDFGTLDFWNESTDSWSQILSGQPFASATYPTVAVYNPVLHSVLFGFGGQSSNAYVPPGHLGGQFYYTLTYDASGFHASAAHELPALPPNSICPVMSPTNQLTIDSDGEVGLMTINPITGHYVVITRDGNCANAMYD